MYDKLATIDECINKVLDYKEIITGETNTRRVMIDPILSSLGYDTSNPYEVVNEYTCDFGVKKGEKVDYALFKNAELTILVEAKSIEVDLSVEHISQLYRYFSVTNAQVGVLSNGLDYWFFTDTKDKNKMDEKPFFKLNIENLRDGDLDKLLLFHKDDYNIQLVKSIFGNLAIKDDIRDFFVTQASNVDSDFSDLIQGKINVKLNKTDFTGLLQNHIKTLLGMCYNKRELNNASSINTNNNLEEDKESVSLRDATSQICTGKKIKKITIDSVDYDINSWSESIYTLITHLSKENNDVEWLDMLDGSLLENKGFIRKNNTKFIKCSALGTTGLYIDMHGSSYMHVQRMKVVCRNAKLGLDKIKLWLY